MTQNGLKSVYVSFPADGFTNWDSFPVVYLDQSIMISDEAGKLNAVLGISPMIQLELAHGTPRIYVEAGIGANITTLRKMDGRQLGSNFLFSPTMSAGIEIPWMDGLFGIFYMFRHLSNAGMFEDNDGVNFQYIVFSMRFNHY